MSKRGVDMIETVCVVARSLFERYRDERAGAQEPELLLASAAQGFLEKMMVLFETCVSRRQAFLAHLHSVAELILKRRSEPDLFEHSNDDLLGELRPFFDKIDNTW